MADVVENNEKIYQFKEVSAIFTLYLLKMNFISFKQSP